MDGIPEFGTTRENEERRDGGCAVVFDPATNLFGIGIVKETGRYWLFSGGIDEGESIEQCVLRELKEESGLYEYARVEKLGEALAHYRNSIKNVSRVAHATCFLVILKSRAVVDQHLEAHEAFELSWKTAAEIFSKWDNPDPDLRPDHWIYFLTRACERLTELGYSTEGAR